MDASRVKKVALLLGIVATALVFILVYRLLDITNTANNPVALETVLSGTAGAAAAPAAQATPTGTEPASGISAVADAYPNVHSNIGVTSPIVGTLTRGQSVSVIGRSPDGVWLEISYPQAANGVGWVSADLMALSPASASVPVATPP